MISNSSAYAVVSLDGRPRCWSCGTGVPTIEGKFCSLRCQLNGRAMLWRDPTPEQISERAAEIRSTWPPGEELRRRIGVTHDELATMGWRPPRLALETIMAAGKDRAAHEAE
jgi:hypothetical protein